MDDGDRALARARYAQMRWNAPLSEAHAAQLLDALDVQPGNSILDLGCGWGELLLRAVAGGADPAVRTMGIGVDADESLLERGRALAAERGLSAQTTFVRGRAEVCNLTADRLICIGAAHAWGGTERALAGLIRLLHPGGRLLFGDGYWQRPPGVDALAIFGSDVLELPALLNRVQATGWSVLHMSTADQCEWDEFESDWRAGREQWLLDNPQDRRAPAIRADLDGRLREYETVYRGVLGFCYLVLAR